jgi:hypothetical protein
MKEVCVPASDEEWDGRRTLIRHLYIDKGLTLRELIRCMAREHGFRAS